MMFKGWLSVSRVDGGWESKVSKTNPSIHSGLQPKRQPTMDITRVKEQVNIPSFKHLNTVCIGIEDDENENKKESVRAISIARSPRKYYRLIEGFAMQDLMCTRFVQAPITAPKRNTTNACVGK